MAATRGMSQNNHSLNVNKAMGTRESRVVLFDRLIFLPLSLCNVLFFLLLHHLRIRRNAQVSPKNALSRKKPSSDLPPAHSPITLKS